MNERNEGGMKEMKGWEKWMGGKWMKEIMKNGWKENEEWMKGKWKMHEKEMKNAWEENKNGWEYEEWMNEKMKNGWLRNEEWMKEKVRMGEWLNEWQFREKVLKAIDRMKTATRTRREKLTHVNGEVDAQADEYRHRHRRNGFQGKSVVMN